MNDKTDPVRTDHLTPDIHLTTSWWTLGIFISGGVIKKTADADLLIFVNIADIATDTVSLVNPTFQTLQICWPFPPEFPRRPGLAGLVTLSAPSLF